MKPVNLLLGLLIVGHSLLSAGDLKVTVTTSSYGGYFSPFNVVAIWIQNSAGTFVKTIGIWAAVRIIHLEAWNASSAGDVDGLTGATRSDHGQISATWDLTGQDNLRVPNGTYQYCIEMTENNSQGPYVRGQIVIDGNSKTVNGSDSSANNGSTYLTGISAVYTDVAGIADGGQAARPALNSANAICVPMDFSGRAVISCRSIKGTLIGTQVITVRPGQAFRPEEMALLIGAAAMGDGIYCLTADFGGTTIVRKILVVR